MLENREDGPEHGQTCRIRGEIQVKSGTKSSGMTPRTPFASPCWGQACWRCARKKLQALMEQEIRTLRERLLSDGITVPQARRPARFGVPLRTVCREPVKPALKVDPRVAEPIKTMIGKAPSFGSRMVARRNGSNGNARQRLRHLSRTGGVRGLSPDQGRQIRKQPTGFSSSTGRARSARSGIPSDRWQSCPRSSKMRISAARCWTTSTRRREVSGTEWRWPPTGTMPSLLASCICRPVGGSS